MKWRPRGDSEDLNAARGGGGREAGNAVGLTRRDGYDHAPELSVSRGDRLLRCVGRAVGLKHECFGRELWVEWFGTGEDADGGRNTMVNFLEKLCKLM
jgi:hypothetical protein